MFKKVYEAVNRMLWVAWQLNQKFVNNLHPSCLQTQLFRIELVTIERVEIINTME